MKQIFKLRTKSYKYYFVLANDYSEAVNKFKNYLLKIQNEKLELDKFESILDSDGSIKEKFLRTNVSNNEEYEIKEIESMDGDFIQ